MNNINAIAIWNIFKDIFPEKAEQSIRFTSHGRGAITIWFKEARPLIFTVERKDDWTLQPYF